MTSSSNDGDAIHGLAAAPEIFVEGYRGYFARNGVVSLNFFSQYFDGESATLNKKAAVRLTIPLADFLEVAAAIGTLAEDIKKQLAEPVRPVAN